MILNEVLSLNAQEFDDWITRLNGDTWILNEVLSLNAQECQFHADQAQRDVSSMKS